LCFISGVIGLKSPVQRRSAVPSVCLSVQRLENLALARNRGCWCNRKKTSHFGCNVLRRYAVSITMLLGFLSRPKISPISFFHPTKNYFGLATYIIFFEDKSTLMSALFCRSSGTVINLQVRTVTQWNEFLLQKFIFNSFYCCNVYFDNVQNYFHQQMQNLLNILNVQTYN
jgi:hypothetical protein